MDVQMYSTAWCRDCRAAKQFLNEHDIPYTEIDVDANPLAAAEVVSHVGKRAIPQLVIDGEWFQPYAPYMWMRSNVLAATMLTIGLFWAPASCALVGAFTIVVGTINTILDLVRTRLRVHGK